MTATICVPISVVSGVVSPKQLANCQLEQALTHCQDPRNAGMHIIRITVTVSCYKPHPTHLVDEANSWTHRL